MIIDCPVNPGNDEISDFNSPLWSIFKKLNAVESKGCGRVVRPKIDVAQIRHDLGLTQKKFAQIYLINLQTLRNWEQGKRNPDLANIAYLICIKQKPRLIQKLLTSKNN